MFNQLTFTCAMPEDAVPCSEAPSFFYLNDNLILGDPKKAFLDDQDIQRAAPLIQSYAAKIGGGSPFPARRPGRGFAALFEHSSTSKPGRLFPGNETETGRVGGTYAFAGPRRAITG